MLLILFRIILYFIFANGVESVVFGLKACQGQFPNLAAIWKQNWWVCGGSIIDETHILTAAHCMGIMTEIECSVTVGVTDVRDPSIIRVRARAFHPHPNYQLAEELQWSPRVQPMPLRRQSGFSICNCAIAGWGAIEKGIKPPVPELRWAQFYVMNTEACKKLNIAGFREVCVFNPVTHASGGPGDSGGPFMCNNEVVGVVVSAKKNKDLPTVFVRLHPYLSFIDEVLKYTLPRPSPTPNVFQFLNQEGLFCP